MHPRQCAHYQKMRAYQFIVYSTVEFCSNQQEICEIGLSMFNSFVITSETLMGYFTFAKTGRISTGDLVITETQGQLCFCRLTRVLQQFSKTSELNISFLPIVQLLNATLKIFLNYSVYYSLDGFSNSYCATPKENKEQSKEQLAVSSHNWKGLTHKHCDTHREKN